MKLLTKLTINPEKVMKSEELLVLKGGLGDGCTCFNPIDNYCYGYLGSTTGNCAFDCGEYWPGSSGEPGNYYPNCSNQPG